MCTYVKSSTHSKVLHNSHSTLVFTMKEFQYLLCLPRKISVLSQLHIIHAPASISHTRRINFFQSTFQRKLICMRNGTSGSKNSSVWVEFPPPPKSFWKIMKYIYFFPLCTVYCMTKQNVPKHRLQTCIGCKWLIYSLCRVSN